jgi:hypothetical protein
MWLKTMLAELGMPLKAVLIYGDSQGAIFNASNPVQEKRMKHIDIQYHFIRECIEDRKINYILSRELIILLTYSQKTLDPLNSSNPEANSV